MTNPPPDGDATGLFEVSLEDALNRLRSELIVEKKRGKLVKCGRLANSIANLYYRNSEFRAALGWFNVAIKWRPDYAYSYCMVGRLRRRLNLGEYERYLRKAIALDPGYELRLFQLEEWCPAS